MHTLINYAVQETGVGKGQGCFALCNNSHSNLTMLMSCFMQQIIPAGNLYILFNRKELHIQGFMSI